MDTDDFKYTHKGWLGICPIYLADIDSDCPVIEPRHWICEPLLAFSTLVFQTIAMFVPEEDACFPVRITGELE